MPRTRLALALTTAATLGLASPALADTKVSIESGNFGTGLNGLYLFVRDAPSFPFDAAMDTVVVSRQSGQIFRHRRWATTMSRDDDTRNGATPMSSSRVTVLGASFVWSVENTR